MAMSALRAQSPPPATAQMDSLIAAYSNTLNTDPEKAREIVLQWLAISKTLDAPIYTARAHYALSNLASKTSDYQTIITHIPQAIAILKAEGFDQGLPACYNMLALGYKNTGDLPRAMENVLLCLEYARAQDDQQQEANANQNIATLYILQKNYQQALESLDRASALYEALGDDDGVYTVRFNYANVLKEQGEYEKARAQYRSVLAFREKEDNQVSIAYIKINLAQILVEQKKYQEAIPALKETLALIKKLGFTSDIAIVLNDLGLCEKALHHHEQAIRYFKEALAVSDENAAPVYFNSEIYQNLSRLYELQGDYKNALRYYKKSVDFNDALKTVDKEKYVAELEARYETKLKETRIALLEKEKRLNEAELQKAELNVRRQRIVRNAFIGGFALVLVTLIALRYFYMQRLKTQRALTQQQEENARRRISELIKDHRLSVIERYHEGQEEERSRIAREIHDGIGSDLAGIKMAFEHYAGKQHEDPQTKRMLQRIDNACLDLRNLSHQLHPLPFSKIGFCSFLKDVQTQRAAGSQINISTTCFPEENIDALPESLLADVYRIVPGTGE